MSQGSSAQSPGIVLRSLPPVCAFFMGLCLIILAGVAAYPHGGWVASLGALAGTFALIGLIAWFVGVMRSQPTPEPAPPPQIEARPVDAAFAPAHDEPENEYERIRPWVRMGMDLLPIVLAGVAIMGPRRSARYAARGYAMWRAIRDSRGAVEEEAEAMHQE